MPSSLPLPTVPELIAAGLGAVRGQRDVYVDGNVGSMYEVIAGMGALLWARQAARDRDIFRNIQFASAKSDSLEDIVVRRFGVARVKDTYGTGTATLSRASTAGGAGTVWAGTRIRFFNGAESRYYAVTVNTAAGATDTSITVPIRATVYGPGSRVDANSGLTFDDPPWDPAWSVTRLTCGEGTLFERAPDYRARVLDLQRDRRKGYLPAMLLACQAAGAAQIVAFPSDYQATTDAEGTGLNVIYVGGPGYSYDAALVRACTLALEDVRMLGCDTQVLGTTTGTLPITATITLWDQPAKFNLDVLTSKAKSALVDLFSQAKNAFAPKRDAIAGAIVRAVTDATAVNVESPAADTLLGPSAWPEKLTRYLVGESDILLSFVGP